MFSSFGSLFSYLPSARNFLPFLTHVFSYKQVQVTSVALLKWIQTVLLDLNLGNYILQSCSGSKEMHQNVWCTCIVIVLIIWHIAFLKFLLLLRLWHFKLPNVLHGQAISKLHNLSLNHQCKSALYCALLLLFMLLFLKLLFVIVNVWNSIYLNWWRMIYHVKYILLKAVTKKGL